EALCRLGADSGLRQRIGAAARASITSTRSWDMTLNQLEAPLARMAARSTQPLAVSSPTTQRRAARFARSVHAIDGLLCGLVSWWQGLIDAQAAVRMVRSCWEGCTALDIFRGLGLVTGISFRTSALRVLFAQSPAFSSSLPLAEQDPQRTGVAAS